MKIEYYTRRAIEEKISTMGDYVKIGYLSNCLKRSLDFDTRRFVLTSLSKLYEDKKMFLDAAKSIGNAADINTTFQGKIGDFVKSTELFTKARSYNEADIA